jgi:hypothetical protein
MVVFVDARQDRNYTTSLSGAMLNDVPFSKDVHNIKLPTALWMRLARWVMDIAPLTRTVYKNCYQA